MDLQYKLRKEYLDICKVNKGVLVSTSHSEDESFVIVKENLERVKRNENIRKDSRYVKRTKWVGRDKS